MESDTLARLSLYLLSESALSFAPLLRSLINASTIPHTVVVILLNWAEPWNWIRQLRDWVRLLREVLLPLDDEFKEMLQSVMQEWQQRKRGGNNHDPGASNGTGPEGNTTIPLGPGEWDEGLGLPLCVVCQNVRILLTTVAHRSCIFQTRNLTNNRIAGGPNRDFRKGTGMARGGF